MNEKGIAPIIGLVVLLFGIVAPSARGAEGDTRSFFYFSFVTLTTVGFGDTVPVSDAARAFTLLEAICGQMFIAVILAALVGKMIAHSGKSAR